MADEPLAALGDKTPLSCAKTPEWMRWQVLGNRHGPYHSEGHEPGQRHCESFCDGIRSKQYYTGRSPLEALSIGVDMKADDVAIRCNIVTLSEDEPYEKKTLSTIARTRSARRMLRFFWKRWRKSCKMRHISFLSRHQPPPLPDLGERKRRNTDASA